MKKISSGYKTTHDYWEKTVKIKKWYFVSLFSSNSCRKQLEKPNEQLFCIFKLENGGRKQANGSRDSFWPEVKPRVGMARGCHLPAWDPHFSTWKYKITRICFFQVFFCNMTGKKVKQIIFFYFFVTPARQLRKQQQLRKLKYEQLRQQPVFITC